MENNLLTVAKILRPHGIKGMVKAECLIDEGLDSFKSIFVGENLEECKITTCSKLNKDFYMIQIDIIKDIDTAEKYRNKSIYIDRSKYPDFEDRVYLSDLVGKKLISLEGKELGRVVDYDDYGASVVLTVRCGAVSYQIPYVNDIVKFDRSADAFVINEQIFKDVRI